MQWGVLNAGIKFDIDFVTNILVYSLMLFIWKCRCNLYNVTVDKDGQPLKPNYVGGLFCCYDGTQCKVKNGIKSVKRHVYLKYTIKWVDWSDSIVPVKVFIFDVTDPWQYTGIHNCAVSYRDTTLF